MMQPHWTLPGTPEYRRIVVALFLSGIATFSLLYCVQPLLPIFSRHFRLDAAQSALSLSLTTGLLAPAILLASAVSESTGRKALMAASLGIAALLNLLAAAAPDWTAMLVLRALEGIALGGAPAIAMTYLAEEIHPDGLGRAMGLYVGGTAIGGMAGRLLSGLAAQFAGWRGALAVIGLCGAASALAFVLLLPPSRNFRRRPAAGPRVHLSAWIRHLRNPRLRPLFAIGALMMGAFVTLYNAATYRLLGPPYDLDQAEIGAIFVIYLLGTAASTLAGALADRVGRVPVLGGALAAALLGLLLTTLSPLALVIGGLAVFTIGFFAGHAVASGSVGRLARRDKAHAASLYLLSYYLGSSVLSLAGGWLWETGGWTLVAGFCAALLLLASLMLPVLRAATLLVLFAAASPAAMAREIPSPFLQQMIRAESTNPAPIPAGMPPLSPIRIAGETVQLGKTPIEALAGPLGIAVEHQGDAGDSVYWFCVRLDVLPGERHPGRDAHALSLWVVADAETVGASHAVSAIALDAIGEEARHCPAPDRAVDLTLDQHLVRPRTDAARVATLYGQPPARRGLSAYALPGMQPDPSPLTLTLWMRNNKVETIWLAVTPDN